MSRNNADLCAAQNPEAYPGANESLERIRVLILVDLEKALYPEGEATNPDTLELHAKNVPCWHLCRDCKGERLLPPAMMRLFVDFPLLNVEVLDEVYDGLFNKVARRLDEVYEGQEEIQEVRRNEEQLVQLQSWLEQYEEELEFDLDEVEHIKAVVYKLETGIYLLGYDPLYPGTKQEIADLHAQNVPCGNVCQDCAGPTLLPALVAYRFELFDRIDLDAIHQVYSEIGDEIHEQQDEICDRHDGIESLVLDLYLREWRAGVQGRTDDGSFWLPLEAEEWEIGDLEEYVEELKAELWALAIARSVLGGDGGQRGPGTCRI